MVDVFSMNKYPLITGSEIDPICCFSYASLNTVIFLIYLLPQLISRNSQSDHDHPVQSSISKVT